MASHQVAIAKASFAAALLRPDPASISRDEISSFHVLLDKAIVQCSPTNVQNCKRWLLNNCIQSPTRNAALGKYLLALSASFQEPSKGLAGASDGLTRGTKPSPKRQLLHILYLLNDVFHHATYNLGDPSVGRSVTGSFQPILVQLYNAAASFENCPKHHFKIVTLLDLWEQKEYCSKDLVSQLRNAIQNPKVVNPTSSDAKDVQQVDKAGAPTGTSKAQDAPFWMPATHGDPFTPYYDLPAGNMMPHIIPNSSQPINPQLVKPLQLASGPADSSLATAVEDFLKDVDRLYQPKVEEDGVAPDLDELGQPIFRDEMTGKIIGGESYYGWSKAFCVKMNHRIKGRDATRNGRYRRSTSRGRDVSSPRRRKGSYSDTSSRSRSRSRSYSRGSSRHRRRTYRSRDGRSRSRPGLRVRPSSRSSSPQRRHRRSRQSRSPSGSSSRSYSPMDVDTSHAAPLRPPPPNGDNLPAAQTGQDMSPFQPPLANPALLAQLLSQNPQMLQGGIPVPPPPPPLLFENNQWFPPPPPIIPMTNSQAPLSQQALQYSVYPGFPVPPPNPPGPPPVDFAACYWQPG